MIGQWHHQALLLHPFEIENNGINNIDSTQYYVSYQKDNHLSENDKNVIDE